MASSYNLDWIQWIDSSGTEDTTSLILDASRNIYTTGSTDSVANNVFLSGISYPKPNGATPAGYMFKLNTSGEYQSLIWVDGTGTERCESSTLDLSRSLIICGTVNNGSTSFTVAGNVITKRFGSTGVGYVSKFNSAGTYQWTQTVDGSGNETIYKCVTDSSNNIFVVGNMSNSTQINISGVYYTRPYILGTNSPLYITRIGPTSIPFGSVQWIDSSGLHQVNGIAIDSSNNIYIASVIQSCPSQVYISGVLRTKPNPTTNTPSVIVKYNSNLVYQWHQFIDMSGGSSAIVTNIKIDSSNNLYAYGYATATQLNISGVYYNINRPSGNTGFLIKYNTNGGYLWHQFIDGSGNQSINDLTYDLCKNLIVTCYNNTGSATAPFIVYISGIEYNTVTRYSTFNARYKPNGVFDNFVNIYPSDNILNSSIAYSITDSSGNLYITQIAQTITISGVTYNSPFIAVTPNRAQAVIKYRAIYIPIAPTGLTVINTLAQQIDLSWNSAEYATSYTVAYGLSGYYDMSAVFSGISGSITGLVPGFDYNFKVASISPDGQSLYGSTVYGIPLYPTAVDLSGIISSLLPGNWYNYEIVGVNPISESLRSTTLYSIPLSQAPSGLTATPLQSAMLMSWNSISGTITYNIYYGLSGVYDLSQSFAGELTVSGIISSLTNDVWYNFKISAVNGGGESPLNAEVYGMPGGSPPPTPTGLSATPQIRAIDLSWNASSGANGYNIYYGLSGVYDLSATYTGLSGTVSGLSGDYYYNFKVSAYSSAGESALSSAVYGLPLLPTPSGLTAISQVEAVDLSWNSISEAVSYIVSYGLSGSFDLSAAFSGISGTIGSLSAGSFYNFKVAAVGSQGTLTAYSSAVYRTPISLAPTGLAAYPLNLAVNLTWDTVSGGALFYTIYYGISGMYTNIASSSLPNKNISGLTYGFTYNFKVTATNLGGESPFSSAVFTSPLPAVPATPIGLTASGISSGVYLDWTASVGTDYYKIYYGLSGSFATIYTISGGSTISGIISPLTPASVYNFKILAGNTGGESALSTAVFATPLYNPVSTPSGFTVVPNFSSVDMSWNSVVDAMYYIVYYGLDGITFGSSEYFSSSPGSITGLSGGVTYYFYIVAGNPDFVSASGGVVSATPTIQPPDTPVLLSAIPGVLSVTLNWSATARANNYYVIYGIYGIFDMSMNFPGTGTTGTISGLTPILYNFAVVATNAGGESAQSNTLTATPYSIAPPITPSYIINPIIVGHIDIILNIYNSPDAELYRIYYGDASGNFDYFIDTVDTTNIVISYLEPDTLYNLKVRTISGVTFVESPVVYIRTLANPSTQTLYSNNNASAVTERIESTTVYIYKQQYDESGKIWTFRSDRERMLYLEGLRRNRAEK